MFRRLALLTLTTLLATAACGAENPLAESDEAVVGGSLDNVHDASGFAVNVVQGSQISCGAVLVHERYVLSHAVCFPSTTVVGQAQVSFGPDALRLGYNAQVAHVWVDPAFNPGNAGGATIVVLELSAPVPASIATPIPIDERPLDASFVGKTVTLVGYGATTPTGQDIGARRSTDLGVTMLDSTGLFWDHNETAGIGQGDSGSPVLFTEVDGEHVVGLASFTTTANGDGPAAAARIDSQLAFLKSVLPAATTTPDAGMPATTPGDDGGCGCHVGGHRGGAPAAFALLGLLALVRRRATRGS
jgi:MYXO-CTERM domain-containing protein